MKILNEMLHEATTLNKSEMKNVKGGVSREEYCATLQQLANSNIQDEDWDWDNWSNAWETHCVY